MSKKLRIVVGITGGIAAYKAVSIVRDFVVAGHHVDVVATESALNFVGKATLEAISRNNVHTSLYDDVASVRHVELGKNADVIVIAPATANTIAQLAHGLAPDLLGTTVLASSCPLVIAPAMHTEMWEHVANQDNISTLRDRGVHVVGPISGQLTGDDVGIGKMSEPEDIVQYVLDLLAQTSDLVGHKILVTAGGTREPLDPVRYIGNRSSGKQARAIAQEALKRGAEVTVIAAHCDVTFPPQCNIINVSTAKELLVQAQLIFPEMTSLFMAAAVSDYRPKNVVSQKIKKESSPSHINLELEENPDILATLSLLKKPHQIIFGFSAETEPTENKRLEIARKKILSKQCDYLVVNEVSWNKGFETDANSITVLDLSGNIVLESKGSKTAVSRELLTLLVRQ